MESVSSCSPSGSGSGTHGPSSTGNQQRTQGVQNHTTEYSREDNGHRILKSRTASRSVDERRDDSLVTGRAVWPPTRKPVHTNRYSGQEYSAIPHHFPAYTRPHHHPPWFQTPHPIHWHYHGNQQASNYTPHPLSWNTNRSQVEYSRVQIPASRTLFRDRYARKSAPYQTGASKLFRNPSRVVIPQDITIPTEISPSNATESSTERSLDKRSSSDVSSQSEAPPMKRTKTFGEKEQFNKLDLLCSATLELGPLQENPAGCSCPKSKCIALYCDCFKAGRRCDPTKCSCSKCLNTVKESGPNGARSKAIQAILARNPRAFTNQGLSNQSKKLTRGDQGCNCIRSHCLKLYCKCFQKGKACDPLTCTCVGCLNLEEDSTGMRQLAIEVTLEKRPDAFKQKSKTKILGAGCACKNNQCVRKYCECFRTGLKCTRKCSCKNCKNI